MTPINLLLVALTAIVSWVAFNNRKLADRLAVVATGHRPPPSV